MSETKNKSRRKGDAAGQKEGPRAVKFDDEGRALVNEAASHAVDMAERRLEEHLGMPLAMHAQDHADWQETKRELIPFIQALKRKAEAQATFWEGWGRDRLHDLLKVLFWGLLAALVFGAVNAAQWWVAHFDRLGAS